MNISNLDHLVITVRNIERTCSFYKQVLGVETVRFGNNRRALKIGDQKINLHQVDVAIHPRADNPTPGAADLCFATEQPLAEVIAHLQRCGVKVELGPVLRWGARGEMQSVYLRDPDMNLIEVGYYGEARSVQL